jgi:UDP-N-acetylmuramoyl-tripeptide--D-alanyl-D-alanine ligase
MSSYSIQKITAILSGKLVTGAPESITIQELLTDSRRINAPRASLFFALKGERHDGHSYIEDLFELGVCNFIVSKFDEHYVSLAANFILVDDTLEALQKLAAEHRNQFSIPVIGITGSNGKTIVKEWLYQLLRADKNIVRSPKSYNSQVGVPLSVWAMEEENEMAIFEAGISQAGEMEKLAAIIQANIGIFTNIGDAHDLNFESRTQKITEKLNLFKKTKVLIYCKDYPAIHDAITSLTAQSKMPELFTWSRISKADLQIGHIVNSGNETELQGIYRNKFLKIKIPFTDDASIENAIHCWALMLFLDYDNDMIAARMEQLSPVAMRLELKEGINNCSIINDSYNSDIGSLTIALDFLNQQKQHPLKTVILSDILQSGKNEEHLYQEVAALIGQKNVGRLIGIGPALCRQQHLFSLKNEFYQSTEDFLKNYSSTGFKDETILLKGARAFGFEKINTSLQQKAHETVLEINLNALIHNLNYYRSLLNPGTKIMAMVKAFSYGSGSFEIANLLQFHRVDYLAVAYADEGLALRKAGISLPIMVMSPEEYSFESMIDCTVSVSSIYTRRLPGVICKSIPNTTFLFTSN